MLKGKTKSGFEFEITDETLDNYELLEAIGDMDENPTVITKIVRLLLGKEGTKKLKDHVRNEDGTVPATKMNDEITEIFESQKEIKNS